MDESPEDIIRGELGPGEQLLWAGRPRQGVVFRSVDVFLIPFSIMWGGFAIFWETMVIMGNGFGGVQWFFALWGVPFVLIGLYFMVGRFWLDARLRARTIYGVTSERVIIVSGLFSRGVKSLNIDTLTDVSLSEGTNRRGTITFGALPPMYHFYSGTNYWPFLGYQTVPSFELPEDAREVYEIIRAAQRASKHNN